MPPTETPAATPLPELINIVASYSRQLGRVGLWAEAHHQLSIILNLTPEEPQLGNRLLVERGLANRMLGNYDAAQADFNQVISQQTTEPTPGDLDTLALAHVGLADIYRLQGDFEAAEEQILYAQQIARQPSLARAKAFDQLGLIEAAKGNPQDSRILYQNALELIENFAETSKETKELTANILHHLGMANFAYHKPATAFFNQKQALEIYQEIADRTGQFNAHAALGQLYLSSNLPDRAREHFILANLFVQGGRQKATLAVHLAEAFVALDDLTQAKVYYSQAIGLGIDEGYFTAADLARLQPLLDDLNRAIFPTASRPNPNNHL